MADPSVVRRIIYDAQRYHSDPVAMLATSLQENAGRMRGFGDNGTSAGPFMFHQGGALGSHSFEWAQSPAAIDERAQEFARLAIHGGKGAAALQRPADPTGYAAGVERWKAQARQLLAQYGGGASPPGRLSPASMPGSSSASLTGGVGVSGLQQAAQQRTQLLQSIIDQNAQLAGIPSVSVPTPTITQRAPLGGVDVNVPLRSSAQPPSSMGRSAQRAVSLARQYLGTPYRWGGAAPGGFDCSGLAQYIYAKAGVRLPRTSQQQFKTGRPVPQGQLQPGDLVFFRGTDGPPSDVGHEGIYIGQGRFIHAPHTGDAVKISTLADPYYTAHYAGGRRVA